MLLSVIALLVCVTAAGENTPPRVAVDTPEEGASLALIVTVSGKATDTEGFNIDSYVEARWNDWEWFRLPNTPADGNRSIVFGEMVNLDFHAPGDHLLQVRAFDGELYSGVAKVNVTVRDLVDIVILPTDITRDPDSEKEEEEVTFFVVVHNQGGEDVAEVEVVLSMNGTVLGRHVVDMIGAGSQTTIEFPAVVRPGVASIHASAFSLQPVEEKSLVNNEAQRTFTFSEPEPEGYAWSSLAAGGLVLVLILAVVVYLAVVVSRKD